jgi:hypothetical protein
MAEPDETLDAPGYQPPRPRKLTAFGVMLITIAVITPVIALVIGIVLPNSRHKSICRQTASFVAELDLACENFRLENGQYPWAKPSEVTAATEIRGKDVYVELQGLPGATINTSQNYLGEVKKRQVKNGTLVDNWGHEIMFRVDPEKLTPVIWSCGPDGKDDTNDGVSPDPAKFPKTYYWFGTGRKSDDLTNR